MRRIACFLVLFLCFVPCFGQQGLDSPEWKVRALAFQNLVKQPLTSSSQQQLIALLDRENQIVIGALRESQGTRGVSVTLGEDYSEYYSTVLGKVAELAQNGNNAAIISMANGAYNADSNIGNLLVDHWDSTLPIFFQAAPDSVGRQARSLEMIGRILGRHRAEMKQDQVTRSEQLLLNALSNSRASVRIAATHASAEAGLVSALAKIRQLAENDPAGYKTGTKTRYPVREAASKAIVRLQR